jgi:hypothetical protein
MTIRPNFGRKNIELSVNVSVPEDRKLRPQLTWMRNQINSCKNKNSELFKKFESGLMLDVNVKFLSKPIRVPLSELEDAHEKLLGKEIKSFSVVYINYLGKKFESRKLFVTNLEETLIQFYQVIVQYLKNWEKPAPKLLKPEIKE